MTEPNKDKGVEEPPKLTPADERALDRAWAKVRDKPKAPPPPKEK
jgi:hypothetical protein